MIKILIFTIIFVYQCLAQEYQKFQIQQGDWSQLFHGEKNTDDIINRNFYLCGFRLASKKNTFYIDCNCKIGWYKWKPVTRCKRCPVKQEKQLMGMRLIFCNVQNWYSSVQTNFDTQSKQFKEWRQQKMCPVNHFASNIAVNFENLFGLKGIKLKCTTLSNTSSAEISDILQGTLPSLQPYGFNKFITSIRLKYYPFGQLRGIAAGFSEYVRESQKENNKNLR